MVSVAAKASKTFNSDPAASPRAGRVDWNRTDRRRRARLLLEAAQEALEHKPTASGIQFIVKAGAVDEYKREETVFAFVFALPRAEMNKIVWNKMTSADELNLSSVDRKSIGRSIAKAYCEDRAQYARRFCQTAAR